MRSIQRGVIAVALTASAAASCGDRGSDPIEPGALETGPTLVIDRSHYVAEPLGYPGPYRQFGFRLRARFTNRGDGTVYLQRCLPSSRHPMYGVRPESAIESEAAYDPAWACMDHDDQIAVPPGETREDNLFITGPNVWAGDDQRPLGVATGRFRLSYLVSPCLGDELRCSPDPDAAVSNEFEVVLRD